jgi:hypothetical protein
MAVGRQHECEYQATLDALPRQRCSIGVLSRLLATRCDDLLAIDVAEGTDTPYNGDTASETFIAMACERGIVRPMLQRRHARYRLGLLARRC